MVKLGQALESAHLHTQVPILGISTVATTRSLDMLHPQRPGRKTMPLGGLSAELGVLLSGTSSPVSMGCAVESWKLNGKLCVPARCKHLSYSCEF